MLSGKMNFLKLLRLNKLMLVLGLSMLSSMLAFSETLETLSGESSYSFPGNLIVYGLVGSNILGVD
jgi:hypothetical protein